MTMKTLYRQMMNCTSVNQQKGSIGNPINTFYSIILTIFLTCLSALATDSHPIISFSKTAGSFSLVANGNASPLIIDKNDYVGVIRTAEDFQLDIERVTNSKPTLQFDIDSNEKALVIIGTLGKSQFIQNLVDSKQLDVSSIEGNWEAFLITTLEGAIEGIDKIVVIAGSDKRGTIYGIYEISSQIGVSPWYWWADVPVKQHAELYIEPGTYTDRPMVKYRGIFLNDEAPALSGWANERFGGFNHSFYEHVFELILRLKGNFLWPAMWNNAFADDDSLNMILADEYGIVMSTSHHEPMMRADKEWNRYGEGRWEYSTNPENIYKFWVDGAKRNRNYESIYTLGMRGQEDRPMSEGENVELLEKIIGDQREILTNVFADRDVTDVPQVWCLYKEVQDYYNKGMRVPEDVTLLLCDDNWGNVRRLPNHDTPERSGGYGMYYHYDFVGGPVSYRWLNVNPISRTWEQMHLCYEHGVDRIWIVNVGDLKPMEFPISFFLDYAWNPDRIPADKLPEYTMEWAGEQFGTEYAEEIANLLTQYTRFNYRRTPEMLTPETYSLFHYREAENVVNDYNDLLASALEIGAKLSNKYKDAYYQLVTHQIEACANLNEMYYTVAKNHLYAEQNRASTNAMAQKAKELFENDDAITDYYHNQLSGGKWNHFMSQTHIGYTSWNNPEKNFMPAVKENKQKKKAEMGIMVEGLGSWWPYEQKETWFPDFDNFNRQQYYIELFNRGTGAYNYEIESKDPWLQVSSTRGEIVTDERIWVSVDWDKVPEGINESVIKVVANNGSPVSINIRVLNHSAADLRSFTGFIEANGYISIEAEHFTKKEESGEIHWQVIPGFGRTLSGVIAFPTTHSPVKPGDNNPYLEYNVYMYSTGKVKVNVYVAPSLNIYNDAGMQYAVSFDDASPQIVKIHEFDTIADWQYPAYWNNSVTDNIRVLTTEHTIKQAGNHTLKVWIVTPGVVFEKIVIESKEIGDSYLGPPESYFKE